MSLLIVAVHMSIGDPDPCGDCRPAAIRNASGLAPTTWLEELSRTMPMDFEGALSAAVAAVLVEFDEREPGWVVVSCSVATAAAADLFVRVLESRAQSGHLARGALTGLTGSLWWETPPLLCVDDFVGAMISAPRII
jgi:hypothetical protein